MRRGLRQRIRLRPAGSHISLSNLVQGGLTILVAVAAAVAAAVASSASGKWQEASSIETQRSLATIEDVRHVYTAEAPGAIEIAFAEARAAELGGGEAAAERAVLAAARKAMDENNLASKRYALPGGGYDVPRRLADVRQQNAGPHQPATSPLGDQSWAREPARSVRLDRRWRGLAGSLCGLAAAAAVQAKGHTWFDMASLAVLGLALAALASVPFL